MCDMCGPTAWKDQRNREEAGRLTSERRELPAEQPFARPLSDAVLLPSLTERPASAGDTAALAHSIAVSGHPQVPLLYLHSPHVAGTEVPLSGDSLKGQF